VKEIASLQQEALPKGISLPQILELAKGDYLRDHTNVIAVGGSGTGKTHVSIGLGVEACRQSKRARFFTAADLVSELEEANEQHQLHRYLKRFAAWDLVIIDELGYLPLTERGAELLFQAFSARHEHGSVIVNTNLPFAEWTQVFRTERLAVAMLDRITHRAHILEMNGESFRLRAARSRVRRKDAAG
jgi:DNA replication protein DnaC